MEPHAGNVMYVRKQDSEDSKLVVCIKLGIDVHARFYVVCRQVDGAVAPALPWVKEDTALLHKHLKEQK